MGITLDKYLPSPRCTLPIHLEMYEWTGKLMGISIRTNNTLELDLPSLVWKQLVGQPLQIADLTAVDQLCTSAMTLLCDDKALGEKGIDAENFEDAYGLDFTYASCDGTTVELVEHGADKAVTSVHSQTGRAGQACASAGGECAVAEEIAPVPHVSGWFVLTDSLFCRTPPALPVCVFPPFPSRVSVQVVEPRRVRASGA